MADRILADRVLGLTQSATVSLPDKAREMRSKGMDVIDLSEGQPHFDTPEPIKKAVKDAVDAGVVYYIESRGLPQLLEEIKSKLEKENGIDVETAQLMVTVGAKEAVATAILCTINPGDEVLIPDPYWGTHAALVSLAGGTPKSVPIHDEDGFRIDTTEMQGLVTSKTKMIILNSPHNPTGMVLPKEDLEVIADICKKKNILAMSDEIYEKMVYDGIRHYSIGSFPGMEDLTITINSLSKSYAMTGWRLGYVAANKEIMNKMLIVHQHSVTHPAAFVEVAAITALRECDKYVKEMVAYYRTARDYFVPELNKTSFFRCNPPKGAFYVFPRIRDESISSSRMSDLLLEKARVLVVPGSGFGSHGEGFVRFVYAKPMSILKQIIQRIKDSGS
ncbi:MAG TPA: pyridoxal phosphate-dependent aminotransferase [Candidatus Bathyarchaeia archaeon]|nr:pyridoxal phosphate-dependent aminotransferase [Candidatus Bathyarchaeia archaeon]